ncbi:hypothetical protein [Thermoflexus sp.]|uniref:hypothetical protein n=1 Tax=Thermoflexus sp. TaxID=1969742 RepID=UPI0035E3F49A
MFSTRFLLLALEVVAWTLVIRLVSQVWPLALSLVIWGLVQYLYWGHMVIYYSFSRIGFFVPFALVFLAPEAELSRIRTRFLIWAFTVVAIAADPFMAFPLGLVHLKWLIRRRSLLYYSRELAMTLAASGLSVGILAALGIFALSGLFKDAVVFNLLVYRKYAPAFADPFGRWMSNMGSGLQLLDGRWLNLDLLSPLDVNGASRQLFTGFFFRLAVLTTTIGLLAVGRITDGLGLYAVSAALLARMPEFFHIGPFVMVSLMVAALLADDHMARLPGAVISTGLRVLMIAGLAWLAFRTGTVLADPALGDQHRQIVAWFKSDAQVAERLTCGRSDVALGDYPGYPGGVFLNFITGRRPPSGYGLLWPWMAEWGLIDVIETLRTEPAIVRVHADAQVGSFKAQEFLRPLMEFLEQNYVPVDGFYVAPEIIRDCPSIQPYLNHLAVLVQNFDAPANRPLVVLTDEPHLLDYVSRLISRPVRAADPRAALLVPSGGACFLAAPAWLAPELKAWGLDLDEDENPRDQATLWPLVCSNRLTPREPVAVWEGDVALEQVAVRGPVRPGGEVEVVALWRLGGAKPADNLHIFHHVIADGQLVAQADGPLNATMGWQPGDLVGTRYRIRLPKELNFSRYELLMGLYRFPELQRLKTEVGLDAIRIGP